MLVTVWRLEQTRQDDLDAPLTTVDACRLTPIMAPSAALARFLYVTVGLECGWRSRREWTDTEWRNWLDRPGVETWMSWQHGLPTGYAELSGGHDDPTTTRIHYLGLLPGQCGRGLGGQLVTDATRRAWTLHRRTRHLPPVERVVLDTTALDSDAALPNYLARGFRVREEDVEDRRVTAEVPRPRAPEAGRW